MLLQSHLLCLLLTVGGAFPLASPQESATPAPESDWIVKIIPVRQANASQLARMISQIGLPGIVGVTDSALVVRAPEAGMEEITALIAELDQPSGQRSTTSQSVVALKHAVAREVAEVLAQASASNRVAVDERNNMVIVSGREDSVTTALDLIRHLDVPATRQTAPPRSAGTLTVEFYYLTAWFADAPARSGPPLPAVLQPVAKALAENGLTNAALISPVRVMVDPSSTFQQAWPVVIDENTTLSFDLRGQADERDEGDSALVSVDARVRATRKGADGPSVETAFSVQTDVTTPLDDFVVLAASPSGPGLGGAMVLVMRITRASQ